MTNNNNDSFNKPHSSDESKMLEFENPIEEKWVIAFLKPNVKKIHYRQFFATGFYEAFDIVMTFSERTNCQILWYKEKRKCDMYFNVQIIPFLESICTFCNSKFNNIEPIKCNFEKNVFKCKSEFCSIKCKQDHFYYMHVNQK